MKKHCSTPTLLCSFVLLMTSYLQAQQPHTFPKPVAQPFPSGQWPRPKTCQDYKLAGKVRLVVHGQDSLYFDPLGRIVRDRRIDWGKLKITNYQYDPKGQLTQEEAYLYHNPEDYNPSEPDKQTTQRWKYNKSGSPSEETYIVESAEVGYTTYLKTQYQYFRDSILVGKVNTDKLKNETSGWQLQLDLQGRWIRKYDLGAGKKLLASSYFDAAGQLMQTYSHNGQDSLLSFQRTYNSEGHTDSEYQYDENNRISLEERITWHGNHKYRRHYYSPDAVQLMRLIHTTVFNEQGEMIADSLYENNLVQKYYFTSGKPDFLQINTDKNGKEVWKIERRYNNDGTLIYHLDVKPGIHSETKYDNMGNPVYEKNDNSIQTYTYQYDQQGNWTERTIVMPSKKTKKERKMVLYYP